MSPARRSLAPIAWSLPPVRIEALARLMEAGAFHPDDLLSARGAATVALAHLAGAPREYLPGLRDRDWLPGGRQVVRLDPEGFFKARGDALRRTVAVPDAAVVVVGRYLRLRGGAAPDRALFRRADGSDLTTGFPMTDALERACRRLGIEPAVTFGEASGYYRRAIEGLGRDDRLFEYMCGVARAFREGRYGVDAPPPDDVMLAAVASALPLAAPWRRLTSSRGPGWSWDAATGGGGG